MPDNIPRFPGQKDDAWIVSAAVRFADGLIICSPRHFDDITHTLVERFKIDARGCTQGFIDQYRVFHTREEAYKIALKNNQIKQKTGSAHVPTLFSEDLY